MVVSDNWVDEFTGPLLTHMTLIINPSPTNDAYMCHGYSHFFHKAMGIYMGGLTLDANTLYVDICFFKPFLHI